MRDFRKLDIWNRARGLIKAIYAITEGFPLSERYVLVPQLRRAVVSVGSNIAEGAGRGSNSEFHRFLDLAAGSLNECEAQLVFAVDLALCDLEEAEPIWKEIREIRSMIWSLQRRLRPPDGE